MSELPTQPHSFHMQAKWKWKLLGCVWLFEAPGTIQSMEFSRPQYSSG